MCFNLLQGTAKNTKCQRRNAKTKPVLLCVPSRYLGALCGKKIALQLLCNLYSFHSFFHHIGHRSHKVSHRHVYILCGIVYCPRIFGAMCFNLLQGTAKNTKCPRRNAKTKPVLLCVPSRYLGALCGKKIALQLLCNLYSFHSFFHHIGHRSHKVSHRHVYILCGIVYCPRIFGAMCFN